MPVLASRAITSVNNFFTYISATMADQSIADHESTGIQIQNFNVHHNFPALQLSCLLHHQQNALCHDQPSNTNLSCPLLAGLSLHIHDTMAAVLTTCRTDARLTPTKDHAGMITQCQPVTDVQASDAHSTRQLRPTNTIGTHVHKTYSTI